MSVATGMDTLLISERWLHMFEQEVSGFEVYESIEEEFIGEEIYQTIGAPARRKLEVREIMNSMLHRYFDLEKAIKEEGWPEE